MESRYEKIGLIRCPFSMKNIFDLTKQGDRGFSPYANQFLQIFHRKKSVKIQLVDVHRQCLLLCPVL